MTEPYLACGCQGCLGRAGKAFAELGEELLAIAAAAPKLHPLVELERWSDQ